MNLANSAFGILNQLADLVHAISDEDFVRPSKQLHGSTLGQHVRHTVEFFLCLEKGYASGSVNYNLRAHDQQMERTRTLALAAIEKAAQFVATMNGQKLLTLNAGYSQEDTDLVSIPTNASRELMYNVEHAIHHMAMIRIAVNELCPYITLHPHFGVAASTLHHQNVRSVSN